MDVVQQYYRDTPQGDDMLILYGLTPGGVKCVSKAQRLQGQDAVDDAVLETKGAYEARLYSTIVNPMLWDQESANLVNMLDYATYTGPDFRRELHARWPQYTLPSDWDSAATVLLLTMQEPQGFKSTLVEQLLNLPVNTGLVPLLFQMIYTLYALALRGVVHNDSHFGNWLYAPPRLDAPQYAYMLDTRTAVLMPNTAMVFLFDWDLAYADSLGGNPYLDPAYFEKGCAVYGMCNATSLVRDLNHVLCEMGWLRYGYEKVCNPERAARGPLEAFLNRVWPARSRVWFCTAKGSHPCYYPRKALPALDAASLLRDPLWRSLHRDITELREDVEAGSVRLVMHAGIDRAAVEAAMQAPSFPVHMQMEE